MSTVKLTSRIPVIIANLKPSMIEGLTEGAELIAEDAQDRVHVDQGDLRDAIHVEVGEDEVSIVAGNEDVFHGHLEELGTTHSAAHPFLIPAYEAGRSRLEDVVGEKLREL